MSVVSDVRDESGSGARQPSHHLHHLILYIDMTRPCLLFQTYETRVGLEHANQVITSIIFTNLTSSHLKDLIFSVLDSLNSKLVHANVSRSIIQSIMTQKYLGNNRRNFFYDLIINDKLDKLVLVEFVDMFLVVVFFGSLFSW